MADVECNARRDVRRMRNVRLRQYFVHAMLWSAVTGVSAGCLTPSPFRDDPAHLPPVTTPSVESLQTMEFEPSSIKPVGNPKIVLTADAPVTHRPLYFEDPRETSGSDDSQTAWTSEDYVYVFTGPIRFLVNLAKAPAEMFYVRPWSVWESDGYADFPRVGCKVDAAPAHPRLECPCCYVPRR